MGGGDLERFKGDLATIRQAAGLELPFGREDIALMLAAGVGGLAASVWALVVPQGVPRYWGFVPLLVVGFAYLVRLRIKYRRSSGRSPVRRREYTIAFVLTVVVSSLAVVYRIWATRLAIPVAYMQGAVFFFAGVMLVYHAILDRKRLSDLGIAVPFMLAGLVLPFVPVPPEVIVGAAIAVGGPACAGIMAWQLWRSESAHAAD